ncbi:MAG: hypothetical protein E3J72_12865 [Planctomycetota bacterium]|nr:MAG: hypothetical protein E3J72_12865 [Planctomycetota bacterium]
MKRVLVGIGSLILGAVIWLPCLHIFFTPSRAACFPEKGIPPEAEELVARAVHLWTDSDALKSETLRQRGSNAEWDFMARTFTVLSFLNVCAAEPSREAALLPLVDRIIEDTLEKEKSNSHYYFLMDYARDAPYIVQPMSSLFVDGEIALMLYARRLLKDDSTRWKTLSRNRVDFIVARLTDRPLPFAESYPDECWMFDHSLAMAALAISDHVDGTGYSELASSWLKTAKAKLVDNTTGLLVSEFTLDGEHLDGPEGSTVWVAASMLSLVDEDFALDQYRRAAKELGRSIMGFGYAREWPASWKGAEDIDSGAMIGSASPASSALRLIAARTFGDETAFRRTVASLHYAAYPRVEDGRRRYLASNQVGDAAVLYGWVTGPLWKKLEGKN